MHQFKSLMLLIILGFPIFPWHSLCMAHPLGHDHHEHDGPSPCELRRQYRTSEPVIWPSMECEYISVLVDDFQILKPGNLKPPFITFVDTAIFIDKMVLPKPNDDFIRLPEVRSNSDPPLPDITLRGPPVL